LKARLGKSQGDFARMETMANADRELYKSFVDRYRQTDPQVDYQAASARVLSHAVVPLRPSFPNKSLLLPVSLALSLGLGTVIAIAKENARRGLQSMDDVQTTVGQIPLGLLPFVRRNDSALVRIFEESVAHVLARVMMPTTASVPRSILVTSALPREGKTKTAIALATAATETGMKVLLVDADLRSRSLSAAAGLDRSDHSLVRLLRREITTDEAIHFSPAWGFSVLPAGSLSGSPMGLLATGTWESTLRSLEKIYDLVLIDSPPVLVAGDTWILARAPEKTVVLSRWGSTPLPTLELAINQLVTAQARIAGVVLTMVAPREHASYGFGDSVVFSPELMRYSDGQRRLSDRGRAFYSKTPGA
jgi:polysaccharide biosynthesis transport protein